MTATSCERWQEEDVAAALRADGGTCDEIRELIPRWMSRCCEACSGKLHRVLGIRELMELASPPFFRVEDTSPPSPVTRRHPTHRSVEPGDDVTDPCRRHPAVE